MKTKSYKSFDIKSYTSTSIKLAQGVCFAYAYMGYEKDKTFIFNKTSAVQYHFIYAEFDLSVVPNTFELKVKNNQGGATIKPTTFRQDILSSIKTGVYQLPLYRVKLDNTGIAEITDIRDMKAYPKRVEYTPRTNKITGTIASDVTATTQDTSDKSQKIATTNFVHLATRGYIDNTTVYISVEDILREAEQIAYIGIILIAGSMAVGDTIEYNGETATIDSYEPEIASNYYEIQATRYGKFYNASGTRIVVKKI